MPDCALHNGSAVILMAQAVPSAAMVPCVDELEPGWSFSEFKARRGAARLTFGSAAVGDDFLSVHLGESCPAAPDEELAVVSGGSARVSREVVVTAPPEVAVAVVPLAGRHAAAATKVVLDLDRNGITGEVVPAGRPAGERLSEALAAGHHALLVDDLSLADALVHVYRPGEGRAERVDREDIVDLLQDAAAAAADQTYQGTWQFRFDGGCVTYEFDAAGPGAAGLGEMVTAALSFVSRTTLDRFTRVHVGLRLDP